MPTAFRVRITTPLIDLPAYLAWYPRRQWPSRTWSLFPCGSAIGSSECLSAALSMKEHSRSSSQVDLRGIGRRQSSYSGPVPPFNGGPETVSLKRTDHQSQSLTNSG